MFQSGHFMTVLRTLKIELTEQDRTEKSLIITQHRFLVDATSSREVEKRERKETCTKTVLNTYTHTSGLIMADHIFIIRTHGVSPTKINGWF